MPNHCSFAAYCSLKGINNDSLPILCRRFYRTQKMTCSVPGGFTNEVIFYHITMLINLNGGKLNVAHCLSIESKLNKDGDRLNIFSKIQIGLKLAQRQASVWGWESRSEATQSQKKVFQGVLQLASKLVICHATTAKLTREWREHAMLEGGCAAAMNDHPLDLEGQTPLSRCALGQTLSISASFPVHCELS